jgi:hypothetical protein
MATDHAPLVNPRGRRLDFDGAREYLGGMPAARLRTLVETRRIPYYCDGRRFFMTVDLDEWLEAQRRPAKGSRRTRTVPRPHLERASLRPAGNVDDLISKRRLSERTKH